MAESAERYDFQLMLMAAASKAECFHRSNKRLPGSDHDLKILEEKAHGKAMKRLRVGDQCAADVAPSFQQYREPQRQQEAGQDTMSEGWVSPPPPPTATTQETPSSDDVDYQSVNHILGALHLERKRREQQASAQQQTTPKSTTSSMQEDTPPIQQRQLAYQGTLQESKTSFRTPTPRKRKKVIHLHTDSKLG